MFYKDNKFRLIAGYLLFGMGLLPAAILAAIGSVFMGFGLLFMLPGIFVMPEHDLKFGRKSITDMAKTFTKKE